LISSSLRHVFTNLSNFRAYPAPHLPGLNRVASCPAYRLPALTQTATPHTTGPLAKMICISTASSPKSMYKINIMKGILITIILLLTLSCNNKTEVISPSDDIMEIIYDNLLKNKKPIKLSEIAEDVEYICLESSQNCLLRRKVDYLFIDSLIFIRNYDHILKFSRDGKYLKKIGTPGRGPAEIRFISTLSILPEEKIIVAQNGLTSTKSELLYYSFSGDLIRKITVNTGDEIKVLEDGRFIINYHGEEASPEFIFRLTNENDDTISVIKNYAKWITPKDKSSIGFFSFKPFYFYKNDCFFKDMYNDTVYSISGDNIIPSYFINLGKYKLPEDLRPESLGALNIQAYFDKTSSYYFVHCFEAANKIFLTSSDYKDENTKHFLFERNSNDGYLVSDQARMSFGFVNDWDGGPDFWPLGNVNDNQVFMPVNMTDFQNVIDKKNLNKSPAEFPEKEKELKKIISDLNITDNPVLMIVTLKK
jgi:hypothetical protein